MNHWPKFLIGLILLLQLGLLGCGSTIYWIFEILFGNAEREFKNPFSVNTDIGEELCGQKLWGREDMRCLSWGAPITFKKIDEPKEFTAYGTITSLRTGQVWSGEYRVKVVMYYSSGGAAGGMPEYYIHIVDRKLVRRIPPLKAPPGWQGILPGEHVSRVITRNEKFDDKYIIELPANKTAHWGTDYSTDDFPIAIHISKDGIPLTISNTNRGYSFQTTSAGIYEIHVTEEADKRKRPAKYIFYFWWDDYL